MNLRGAVGEGNFSNFSNFSARVVGNLVAKTFPVFPTFPCRWHEKLGCESFPIGVVDKRETFPTFLTFLWSLEKLCQKLFRLFQLFLRLARKVRHKNFSNYSNFSAAHWKSFQPKKLFQVLSRLLLLWTKTSSKTFPEKFNFSWKR